jgi:hypothetical protein
MIIKKMKGVFVKKQENTYNWRNPRPPFYMRIASRWNRSHTFHLPNFQ